MRRIISLLLKVSFFCVAVVVVYTQFTDADLFDQKIVAPHSLSATTLDFSSKDTANNTDKSLFFSVVGMLPDGFQVESVRIKKEGELPFHYSIQASQTGGDTQLCQALQVKILQNWSEKFSGALLTTSFASELSPTDTYQDLIFSVSLPAHDVGLANKSCAFTFTVSTQQAQGDHFSDSEVLQSTITTGTWTN